MKLRHEYKHYINYSDYLILRQRLKLIMTPDQYTDREGKYRIRSMYFDNIYDKALREKLSGVNCREKFRFRFYNDDTSLIRLEKKSKINNLCNKVSTKVTKEQVQAVINGNYQWMADSKDDLLLELYSKMKGQLLKPVTIVEYIREPYVMDAGNVRVTIDSNIKTGFHSNDFLNTESPMIKASDEDIILEVKYDNFIPAVVQSAVNLSTRRSSAYSKYSIGRIYG